MMGRMKRKYFTYLGCYWSCSFMEFEKIIDALYKGGIDPEEFGAKLLKGRPNAFASEIEHINDR
jgi:hypothetical protein